MYGEGIDLDDCELTTTLQITDGKGEREVAITNGKLPADIGKDARLSLSLLSSKAIAQPRLSGQFGGKHSAAKASGKRQILIDGKAQDVPLYRAEAQSHGASAAGPAEIGRSSCRERECPYV